MNLGCKRRVRTFKLRIDVPQYSPWVQDVIDSIEKDELRVYRPDDDEPFGRDYDADGTLHLERRAVLAVSIREWLPVGCQFVRLGQAVDDDPRCSNKALAFYRQNGGEVLWPPYAETEPPGPAALVAGVVVCHGFFHSLLDMTADTAAAAERKVKFVIAHELVHAFDAMRFIVPAFMDWGAFWKHVLDEGLRCNVLLSRLADKSIFVDNYGSENELAMIKEFWPSQAKNWFSAFHPESDGK